MDALKQQRDGISAIISRVRRKAQGAKGSCRDLNTHRVAILSDRLFHVKQSMGMSPAQARMTFGNFSAEVSHDAKAAKESALLWYAQGQRHGGNLVLCGKTGVGKTHLSCGIMSALLAKQIDTRTYTLPVAPRSRFCGVLKLKRLMRVSFQSKSSFGSKASSEIRALTRAPVVVLDDLGVERDAPFFNEAIIEIAEGRSEPWKTTIITTNKSSSQLKLRYGDAAFSRLILSSEIILVKGQDMRGRRDGKTNE